MVTAVNEAVPIKYSVRHYRRKEETRKDHCVYNLCVCVSVYICVSVRVGLGVRLVCV